MKLAIVRQKYTPYGGAERFVQRALEALVERGVEVEVIARRWAETATGVRCDPFYLGRLWRDTGFARCVRKVIDAGCYDLVQSHERIPGCHVYRAGDGVHATWLELRSATQNPVQRLAARLQPWHRYTLAAEAAMFRHPALRAVICNARMVKEDIERRFPETAGKLHVIHNGVDLDCFHPGLRAEFRRPLREKVSAGGTAPVILFVGSGYARKGVATLIEALACMKTRDAEVWVVGRDSHPDHYLRQARRLGVSGRVRLLGPQTDVRPYYAAADVFCLPTLYDPFPNAALEAFACGLPVVTTTTCGAAELVADGDNGWVVVPNDPAALGLRLDEACAGMASQPRCDAMRGTVLGLDWNVLAGQLTNLYRDLL
ncbi:MAG: glycosyltransferase family 4 protein [Pseudomonadota bacterium]